MSLVHNYYFLISILFISIVNVHSVCVCVCISWCAHVVVRAQLSRVGSLLPPHGFWKLNSSCKAYRESTYIPTETSCWPYNFNCIKLLDNVIISYIGTICNDLIRVISISISISLTIENLLVHSNCTHVYDSVIFQYMHTECVHQIKRLFPSHKLTLCLKASFF